MDYLAPRPDCAPGRLQAHVITAMSSSADVSAYDLLKRHPGGTRPALAVDSGVAMYLAGNIAFRRALGVVPIT